MQRQAQQTVNGLSNADQPTGPMRLDFIDCDVRLIRFLECIFVDIFEAPEMGADLNVAMSLIALQKVPIVWHHPIVGHDRSLARRYGELAAAPVHRVTVRDDYGSWAHLLGKKAATVAEMAIVVMPESVRCADVTTGMEHVRSDQFEQFWICLGVRNFP